MRWHFGFRHEVAKGRYRWVNGWLAHPCRDLAFLFEVGDRARREVR